jgi:hypothetical protein
VHGNLSAVVRTGDNRYVGSATVDGGFEPNNRHTFGLYQCKKDAVAMSNDFQQQQQQLSSEFGDEPTGVHQSESIANAAEPLLQPSSSAAAADGTPRSQSSATAAAASTNGQTSAMSGRLRSTSTGDRPKTHSVHIVEPLPTLSGARGSRASVGGGGYTVIKSEEKHGILQRAIPVMPLGLAIVACILNIVLPGIGKRYL